MEHQKITNLLSEASDSIFANRKWNNINGQWYRNYDVGNKFIYIVKILKSNFCNYNDAFILVRVNIIITRYNNPTKIAFENFAPFIKCIKQIDEATTDDAEDLDMVMLVYNVTI